MNSQIKISEKAKQVELDFEYQPDPTVDLEQLSGNANLALHHHMAPPDGHDEDDEE